MKKDNKISIKPYGEEGTSKKEEIATTFNNISAKYDFLNHFLSVGIDKLWRKKVIKMIKPFQPKKMLDIATGTGDFALESLKLEPKEIIGIDISQGMLSVGNTKMKKKGVDNIIKLKLGDSEDLPFEDGSFESITVGFGVRNFQNLEKGLGEMCRVLKKGYPCAVLEFSKPKRFPVKQFYGFHSKYVIPFFGKRISKDETAYKYLPESIAVFPEGEDFVKIMEKVGFEKVKSRQVSGGIATIYLGIKK
jgi:demethylmenaquinone methyltransferase / 2-methoxy-6-polyprenyl-1,4-benzoquinol methylase